MRQDHENPPKESTTSEHCGVGWCVQIWRLPDLVLVTTLRGHKRGVWAAQFSPVDQAVATASGDKTLRLWALADGTCLKTFEGHTASVLRLNFLSAGTQVNLFHVCTQCVSL